MLDVRHPGLLASKCDFWMLDPIPHNSCLFLLDVGVWLFEAFLHRRYHLTKPIEIQSAQYTVTGDVCECQPRRDRKLSRLCVGGPDVPVHHNRLVRAPDEATTAKCCEEHDAIDQLSSGTG